MTIRKGSADPYYSLEKVAPVFQQGDFVMGNLEGVIGESLSPTESKAGTGGGFLDMPPKVADALKRAGFGAFAIANNHTMDFGAEGILQTLANLERVGIAVFGGGRNIHEARKPAILERDGVKMALLAYTSVFVPGTFPAGENKPGAATVAVNTSYRIPSNIGYAPGAPPCIVTTPKREDVEKMLEDVRLAKAKANIVVVNFHWGLSKYAFSVASGLSMEECPFYVLNYQEDMGRAAIDAGADLVIGHHSHQLQGMELYKGKLICYSLGILTFPFSMGENFGEESVILKGYIDCGTKQITRLRLIPVVTPTETMQPHVVPIAQASRIISEMERLSKKYGTKFHPEGEEIAIGSLGSH